MSSNGFLEIMNNSITRSDYCTLIDDLDESNNIIIINPLSRDINSMRQSLLFSGLETISYNILPNSDSEILSPHIRSARFQLKPQTA